MNGISTGVVDDVEGPTAATSSRATTDSIAATQVDEDGLHVESSAFDTVRDAAETQMARADEVHNGFLIGHSCSQRLGRIAANNCTSGSPALGPAGAVKSIWAATSS